MTASNVARARHRARPVPPVRGVSEEGPEVAVRSFVAVLSEEPAEQFLQRRELVFVETASGD